MKTLLLTLLLVPMVVFGQNNYSMSFDGQDDYLSLSNIDMSANSSLSICAWIKPTDISSQPGTQILRQDYADFFIMFEHDAGLGTRMNFGLSTSSGFDQFYITIDTTEWIDLWTFITVTYDGGTKAIYRDGELLGTNNGNGGNIIYSPGSFRIGSFDNNGVSEEHYSGNIDDVSIWDYDLESAEIQQYMDCPPVGNEEGLLGYWNFEEGSGTTLTTDQTSNGNDGTLNGGVTWSADVPAVNCGNVGLTDQNPIQFKNLIKILDLMGRETSFKPNTPLIYVYDDGSIEKVFSVEY